MQFIQCNNRLDVVSVFVFFWARTMRTMAHIFYVRRRKVQHYKNIVIEYGHFRLKITGISRPNTNRNASQVPALSYIVVNCRCSVSPNSMIICLFGDEVRFYFIVLRPVCLASRCRWSMTVGPTRLNKQPHHCISTLSFEDRNQSRLICAAGSQDVFMWLFIGQVMTVTDKWFWHYTCPSDKWYYFLISITVTVTQS